MGPTEVRESTTESEWRDAFVLFGGPSGHLTVAEYLDSHREIREEGYRLLALVDATALVTVAGVAVRTNSYNGRHLFVYHLVTRPGRRSEGHGGRRVSFLEGWARDRGCESVTLGSGLWREDAHRFYEEDLGVDRFWYTFAGDLDGDRRLRGRW